MISDLHHVSINVDDLAAAEYFYVDILGLERLPRPDFGIGGLWLGAGERQVHLIELPAVPDDLGQHFAFRVSDLDATIAHLKAHGIATDDVFESPVGRQVALHDPCGNRVELNQPN
jgi:catechol 2,3-dioxygenase-like lactoylglutathione lyase family enzyme